jgi:hypothetical protein
MVRGIYLIQPDGALVEMKETPYDTEAVLQELLARYPSVLAGEQVNQAEPRRWLLISREMPVASEEGGGGRWSLDHLFLDQDGVPTLVEVKRGADTRIRREVVGQMLDYAANGVVYWPVDAIRTSFVNTCAKAKLDPEQALLEFLGADVDPQQFWQRVRTNLTAGRIRMVFVADDIPPELRRIVEFLNSQMSPADVFAIEIRQFVRGELKTLVPSVVGETSQAQLRKTGGESQWDETSLLKKLEERGDRVGQQVVHDVLDWASRRDLKLWWGRGATDGSVLPGLRHRGTEYWPLALRTGVRDAYIQVQFAPLSHRPPFDDRARREDLRTRLNRIPGVQLAPDTIDRYPGIPMAIFAESSARRQLIETLDWLLEEIKQA